MRIHKKLVMKYHTNDFSRRRSSQYRQKMGRGDRAHILDNLDYTGMVYGVETWAVKKAQKKNLDVAEMWMLRWTVESLSWTELGMNELERQRRLEKYSIKCRNVG